jgi:hypothetical protein
MSTMMPQGVEHVKTTYRFTITLAGVPTPGPGLTDAEWSDRMDTLLDELTGRVLAAGLEDVGLCGNGSHGEVFYLDFDREADSLAVAVAAAIAAVERAGLAVARVDVDATEG